MRSVDRYFLNGEAYQFQGLELTIRNYEHREADYINLTERFSREIESRLDETGTYYFAKLDAMSPEAGNA